MMMRHSLLLVIASLLLVSIVLTTYAKELQDPTKPLTFVGKKAGKKILTPFILSEIRITPQDRQAVINGKRLRKGGLIASYQLHKIEIGYVILTNEKEKIRLNLINSRVIRKNL